MGTGPLVDVQRQKKKSYLVDTKKYLKKKCNFLLSVCAPPLMLMLHVLACSTSVQNQSDGRDVREEPMTPVASWGKFFGVFLRPNTLA